jgi:hypothetical protein
MNSPRVRDVEVLVDGLVVGGIARKAGETVAGVPAETVAGLIRDGSAKLSARSATPIRVRALRDNLTMGRRVLAKGEEGVAPSERVALDHARSGSVEVLNAEDFGPECADAYNQLAAAVSGGAQ